MFVLALLMTACDGEKQQEGAVFEWVVAEDQSIHEEKATVTGDTAWLEPSVVSHSNYFTGVTESD